MHGFDFYRGQDQQGFVGERRPERLCRALKRRPARSTACSRSFWAFVIAAVAAPSEAPGARLKEIADSGHRELALVIHGEARVVPVSKWVKALSGTAPPVEDCT